MLACLHELFRIVNAGDFSEVFLQALQAYSSTSGCTLAPVTLTGAVGAGPQRKLVLDVVQQLS
jgi:hypothetical protein